MSEWKRASFLDADIKPRTHPDVAMFRHDADRRCIVLMWGNYEYDFDLDDIKEPEDLLWKIHHIGRKTWRNMTPARIAALVEAVAAIKGWRLYAKVPR